MNSRTELLSYPTVREGLLYETKAHMIQCNLCERRCLIHESKRGFCKTRMNIEGKLYTLVYGDINALESRPIEIKPFFHFYPGSSALTFSTWSCNFTCPWCQNFHLSRKQPEPENANFIAPEAIVKMAVDNKDDGLCGSFTEPTLLIEYCLDTFPIAKEKGLYNCFVSNGYMTLEALRMLRKAGMDAIKIDMKGNSEVYKKYCAADSEVVWRNIKEAKHLGMHVEIVNLVITGVNDSEACLMEIISRCKEIDPYMPLHFTRYHPAYKFSSPATKKETLEKAYIMAKDEGIKFPYVGNIPGHEYENTYCPSCGEVLIRRSSYRVTAFNLKDKRCPRCGEAIPIVRHSKHI
jgi:pyruvate formate lyase activating enzyme